jgi:hypothetical protein
MVNCAHAVGACASHALTVAVARAASGPAVIVVEAYPLALVIVLAAATAAPDEAELQITPAPEAGLPA